MTSSSRPPLPPGFMVLHGNRLEDLRDLLVQFLRARPLAPLAPELLLVQSAGMKHWLEISLADEAALGIFAATRAELPSAFLWQVYRQLLGVDQVPTHMPFDKSSLVWRLMRLLPGLMAGQPVYRPLQRYLSEAPDARKLYQLALQLADVFDAYQSYRADWLADWAQGRDQLRGPQGGESRPVDAAQAWQPALWRALREDVGPALAEASRAAVHARSLARLQALAAECAAGAPRPVGLPERIVVFGISSLPQQAVEALAALGQLCQVLMLVHNPCQYYWGDLVEGHAQLRRSLRQRQPPKAAALAAAENGSGHPLLASWGKQGRDYLHMLDEFDDVAGYRHRFSRVDVFVDPLAGLARPSQLAQLQSDMLQLQRPASPWPLAEDDHSITLLSCHSAQREVEVLHDRLLAWFEADPGLRPRDVMVMVPDISAFAPHIQAVFGRFAPGQARHIPYSVADRSARQSPLVQALQWLLSLPQARVTLAEWLGLFEVAALRQRFGLGEAELDELQAWLQQAGVRWGLDAEHRRRWGLSDELADAGHNTWAFGLRRLLLGYALGEGAGDGAAIWAGTLAQPALSGLDAPVAEALLGWLEAVDTSLQALGQAQPPAAWGERLRELVARFFEAGDEAEARQIEALLVPLDDWLLACEQAGLDSPVPLEVVREHWLGQLQDGGLQQRFLGGGVQFATLMPMRSIPFRVVCLLGMNDGDYPRQMAPRDFDLMSGHWRAGDRSRREDDRYLFLEALLSAREKFYLSWQGHRATDNAERPPSVLVAQLIDFLASAWQPARRPQAQPLQPFSEAYFSAGSGFRTYDADWARAHQGPAPAAEPAPAPAAGPAPLPERLGLADLRQLLRQPVEVFFKRRLGVVLNELEEVAEDSEPFALDGLDRYQAGQAVLEAADPERALAELPLTGQLPLAAFGQRELLELKGRVAVVQQRLAPWSERYAHALPAQPIALAFDGLCLQDQLLGLWAAQDPAGQAEGLWSGPCLQRVLRPGAVLQGKGATQSGRLQGVAEAWARHLAGCAQGLALRTAVLGLDGQLLIRPLPAERARALLAELLQVYRAAWARPLPVAGLSAWAYGLALREGAGDEAGTARAHEAARSEFEGGFQRRGEREASPYLQRCFERYEDVMDELPHWAERLYGELACQLQPGPPGDTE